MLLLFGELLRGDAIGLGFAQLFFLRMPLNEKPRTRRVDVVLNNHVRAGALDVDGFDLAGARVPQLDVARAAQHDRAGVATRVVRIRKEVDAHIGVVLAIRFHIPLVNPDRRNRETFRRKHLHARRDEIHQRTDEVFLILLDDDRLAQYVPCVLAELTVRRESVDMAWNRLHGDDRAVFLHPLGKKPQRIRTECHARRYDDDFVVGISDLEETVLDLPIFFEQRFVRVIEVVLRLQKPMGNVDE